MAWKWSILRSAVEQEILFPSQEVFKDYMVKLEQGNIPYEIVAEQEQEDGTLIVVMRKPYNNTKFLSRNYIDSNED